jgi:uncharacterized protein YraI
MLHAKIKINFYTTRLIMKKIFIIAIVAGLLVTVPLIAHAQLGQAGVNLKSAAGSTGLSDNLPATIGAVIKTALALVGTIFLVLTIYAGILWMTAAGAEEQIEKAKKIITACVIGLFITLSAYAITYFVTTKLNTATTSTGTLPPS